MRTSFSVERSFAVSAMKCTLQKTMTSTPGRFDALMLSFQRVADEVGDILHFGPLVVMRQNDGVAFLFQAGDVRDDVGVDVSCHGIIVTRCAGAETSTVA